MIAISFLLTSAAAFAPALHLGGIERRATVGSVACKYDQISCPSCAPAFPRRALRIHCTADTERLSEAESEAIVEEAVMKAEALWAKALEARKEAEELSTEAERLAEEAGNESDAASAKMGDKFSLSMLGDATTAMNASLGATGTLADAVSASEKADVLEMEAELALLASEDAIDNHLAAYPTSTI